MKTFSRVLLVILFLATCGVAVYAIREGNSILAWLVTICIVGYAVWLAFDMIYSRLKILDSRVVQALEEMRERAQNAEKQLQQMIDDTPARGEDGRFVKRDN